MNKMVFVNLCWVMMILALLIFGSEARAREAEDSPGEPELQRGDMQQYATESHADDSFYLRDQIDLELNFGSDVNFVISARPGELIHVNRFLPGGFELRQALVVMPIKIGEALPPRREELRRHPTSEIAFRVMPYCLNTLAANSEDQLSADDSCLPRSREDLGADFLLPLVPLMKKEIYLKNIVSEGLTGAQLKVIKYRESGYRSFGQFNPYATCCLEFQDVEVCSCSVISPVSSCNRGCPISAQMTKEMD